MKKLFIVLVALALIVGFSGVANATVTAKYAGGTGLGTLRTATFVNYTSSVDSGTASVTTAIIPGKCRILGWDVAMMGSTGYGWVEIQDVATFTAGTRTIAEIETTPTYMVSKWLPMGMEVQYGISVGLAAYSTVTIYYVQDKP